MYRDGKRENTLLWIDSSQKDSDGDGEYTVTLVEPVRNVVGVRVLEATIPATIMSINGENNRLALYTVSHPSDERVNPEFLLRVFLQDGFTRDGVTVHDPNHLVSHTTVREDLQVFVQSDASRVRSTTPTDISVMCIASGLVPKEFQGPRHYDPESNTTTVVCAHSSTMSYVCDAAIIRAEFSLPIGRYDGLRDLITEFEQGYSVDSPGFSLDFIQPLTPKPERSMRVKIVPGRVWTATGQGFEKSVPPYSSSWCAINVPESSCLNVLGLQSNPTISIQGVDYVTSSPDVFASNSVVAQSMVNLASERYVWLRCPEIEQHMCAGVGRVLQRGIGVFRLDLPGVFKEETTEYISMIPPEFHPISKLSKLSFRFDIGSEQDRRYNFNGIKHFMLLSLTSLKMDRGVIYKSLPRALNPNYRPGDPSVTGCITTAAAPLTDREEVEIIRRHNRILSTADLK